MAYTWLEELPWWSRVWIVQETAMAKDAIVGCGSRWVPWRNFELWGIFDDAARSKPYRGGTQLGKLAKIRMVQQED